MSGGDMGAAPALLPRPPAWVAADAWEARDARRALPENAMPCIGNSDAVRDEQRRQWQERHGAADTFWDTTPYEVFAPIPHVSAPSFLDLDWMWRDGLILVSARLLSLLDQPVGSLQALPTKTEWVGANPPGWSYLWLSHVPRVPALDLARCQGDMEWIARDGQPVQVLRPNGGGERLQLRFRPGFVPPCGLFWAAEGTGLLLVSDAAAEAVQSSGCTGLEFLHPKAPDAGEDDCLRRIPDGVEPHPCGVARREAHARALLDPSPRLTFTLPPPGSPLHWDHSTLDLVQWDFADAELRAFMTEGGGWEDHASLLCSLLDPGIGGSQRTLQKLLSAIADAKVGRAELWSEELSDEVVVTVRPDALWLYWDHASTDKRLRAFPLDGMEAVLHRWAEAIRRSGAGED